MSSVPPNSSLDPSICRDFLRNVCKRGRRCKFKHPAQNECEKIRRSERVFCHDFQNSTCNRPACKFLHYSREAEEVFRITGRLPDEVQYSPDGSRFQSTEEKPPVCKDYLNGLCSRGSACKYRHVYDPRLQAHLADTVTKFRNSDKISDARCLTDAKSALCTQNFASSVTVSLSPTLPTSVGLDTSALHQSILTLPSASHLRIPQTATINGVVVSAHDATLTATQGTSIVNVVDRLTIPSSNIQHTLYAHPSSLGTLTPLVSVSSTNHAVPCSSVLAVVADPGQHPRVIQHPTAVATSQTAYHWVSNAQPPVQHHLLSTSSNVSSAPTLLTIPLPSFACDTSNHGSLIPHPGVVYSTPQQPTVITSNSTLTNVSATCYPSYNLLHINQPPVIENPSVTVLTNTPLADKISNETSTTTSVSSSTTAALAAAAAAGYIAQHLPMMTATQVTPGCDPSRSTTVPTCCAQFTQQTELTGSTQQSASLAAASNLPAVSAAAVAAVAAATAFAARSSTATFAHDVHSGRILKRCISPPNISLRDKEISDGITNSLPESSERRIIDGGAIEAQLERESSQTSSCNTTGTINTTTTSHAFLVPSQSPRLSEHYQEDENAKTAAAVAAAACIGAMFSQPMGTRSSPSSSMAAMLGDLMCGNRRALVPVPPPEPRETGRSSGSHDSLSSESCIRPVDKVESPRRNVCVADGLSAAGLRELTSSETAGQIINNTLSASQFCSEAQMTNCLSYPSNSSSWSSVATTVASAAHAVAAAAVAATAAMTGSAKFFHMSKQKLKQLPNRSTAACGLSASRGCVTCTSPNSEFCKEPVRTSSQSVVTSKPAPELSAPSLSGSTERTGISPNTAVTMTSAAAAAAMVAAAASAAAKQRHMISDIQIPPYSSTLELNCGGQSGSEVTDHEMAYSQDPTYSVFENPNRYMSANRRVQIRSGDGKLYGYSLKRRNSSLHQALVEDDDDEDGYVFDDAESSVSLQASPEGTPPYTVPLKFPKRTEHVQVSYVSHVDNCRPPSCETSPSNAFYDSRLCRASRRVMKLSSATTPDITERFERKADGTKLRTEQLQKQCALLHPLNSSSRCFFDETYGIRRDRILTTISKTSIVAGTLRSRRAHSADSRPSVNSSAATIHWCRSTSYPVLSTTTNPSQLSWSEETIDSSSYRRCQDEAYVPSEASISSDSVAEHLESKRTRESHDNVDALEHSNHCITSNRLRRLRRITHLPLHSVNHEKLTRMYRGNENLNFRNSVQRKSMRLHTTVRPQLTASPDSVLTEEYSGHDDVDDIDTEYYDEDLFDISDTGHSTRSSRTPSGKPATTRCGVRCAPGAFTRTSFSTASMRQQHALKAENARLRRKLSDLMRQRGDLRAANEILLQQNARLRHSSKRVSAVARMAESATKIIEAHNKSQLVQPAPQTLPTPVYRASGTVAVVATPQQQTNTPALSGVYVSSPTASNSQQTPHAVAVVASAVPGTAIALPPHQPLTTVQIQPSSETIVTTPVSTQTPIGHQHNESLSHQGNITNFYQHGLGHPLGTLSASIASVAHQNLAPVSSAIQVCHYPAPSGGTIYSNVPHATAAAPGIVPVGAPNAVTLVLGQPPPTAYATIGTQGPSLHLTSSLKADPSSVGSVSRLSYPFPSPSAVLASVPQCPSNCSLASPDMLGNSTNISLAAISSSNVMENSTPTPPQAPDYSPHSLASRSAARFENRSQVL
ncbi:Zinc finger CCCH domain-containing protein 10 [Fasciola gigantica]|uniref:Zinc finger CCCH domain-containing protein 10 n=1 Tax=Fasciola gigantica TaxID=46835 RepID=A0A504YMV6_FASGI|nr:Zinc finger CCCH domain-containing protein 10 [Fasciola gigantica]